MKTFLYKPEKILFILAFANIFYCINHYWLRTYKEYAKISYLRLIWREINNLLEKGKFPIAPKRQHLNLLGSVVK